MAAKKRGKRKKSRAAVVLGILAIALFASGAMLAYNFFMENQRIGQMRDEVDTDLFYEGITINGIPLGGMTKQQALDAVTAYDGEQSKKYYATITIGDKQWTQELPTVSNANEIVDAAYMVGRIGDLEVRYNEVTRVKQNGISFTTNYTCDSSKLEPLIESIAQEVDVDPVNAAVLDFNTKTKEFTYSDEAPGNTLDAEALIAQLNAAVEKMEFPIELTGTLHETPPLITRAMLQKNNKLLASFETTTTNVAARNNNIRLATEAINGACIMPGETFSINNATGQRSPEKGYQDAGAYRNGRLIPEPGGGVCQVSTTLYNAAVRSGLEITERNNHSQTVSYVPIGEDAMINFPDRDLQLTNNGVGPVYIVASFADRKLLFEIYGTQILEDGVKVELNSETLSEIDPPEAIYEIDTTLAPGEKITEQNAKKGYRVETTVSYKKGDTTVKEYTYRSYYSAAAEIIKYNPSTQSVPSVPDGSAGISTGEDGIPVITVD